MIRVKEAFQYERLLRDCHSHKFLADWPVLRNRVRPVKILGWTRLSKWYSRAASCTERGLSGSGHTSYRILGDGLQDLAELLNDGPGGGRDEQIGGEFQTPPD